MKIEVRTRQGESTWLTKYDKASLWRLISNGGQATLTEMRRLLALAESSEGLALQRTQNAEVVKVALEWLHDLERDPLIQAAMDLGGEIKRIG